MISEFNTEKSCLSILESYADSKSYSVAYNGKTFEPVATEIYLQEALIPNDNEQGLSNNSSEIQFPIYQITIHTPKIMGKWKGIEIYAQIQEAYERGANISLDESQRVYIEQINRATLESSDTHNRMAVSINLSVIG